MTFASRICWYLVESILSFAIFPVPLAATQPQRIKNATPYLTGGKVSFHLMLLFFVSEHTLLIVAKEFYFNFISPQYLRQACVDVLLHTTHVEFLLKTLPCASITAQWTTTPNSDKSSSWVFAAKWGFWIALLTSLQAVLSQADFSWFSRSHFDLHSFSELPSLINISHSGNCKLTTICYALLAWMTFIFILTHLLRGQHSCSVFAYSLKGQSIKLWNWQLVFIYWCLTYGMKK